MSDNFDEIVRSIGEMEARLNYSREVIDSLERAFLLVRENRSELQKLLDYYGSERWFADRKLDSDGKLEQIPRGVLCEDYVYDLLTDYIRLMRELRDFCDNDKLLKE